VGVGELLGVSCEHFSQVSYALVAVDVAVCPIAPAVISKQMCWFGLSITEVWLKTILAVGITLVGISHTSCDPPPHGCT